MYDDIEFMPLSEQLEYYRKECKQQQKIIYDFVHDCRVMSDDILFAAGGRVIARMDKDCSLSLLHDDAVGDDMSFTEALSVELFLFGYALDEINPFLPEYVSDLLDNEISTLRTSELFIIEQAENLSADDYDYNYRMLGCLENSFYGLLEDIYYSEKVQKHCENF